ncbi:thiolase family protein [Shimia biformata]|uniref:thiolase family protein n=1 Tax=Shimia biformata TaxID=1294299 RepID=UPI001EF32341|nr:thiolase family protein [Shimia biformata]
MSRWKGSADRQPVIVAARRSAIGRKGGMFASLEVEDLAAPVLTAALRDAGLKAQTVDDVILGNAAGPGGNVARVAALLAGFPVDVPAMTVDRQCGSGLEAVLTACHKIAAGAADVVIAGGVESCSRAPIRALPPRAKGDEPQYYTRARFAPDAIGDPDMGEAAENVAEAYRVTRQRQDRFALQSQTRALAAQAAGAFDAEIVPIDSQTRDESPREGLTLDRLARLRPAFRSGGSVTAGNACPLNDGAAALVVMSRAAAQAVGHETGLGFVDGAAAGVDPNLLGIGPVASTRKLLSRRPDLSLDDMFALEFNEAFAAQVLASLDQLDLPDSLPNQQGGAIALGHPFGASGAILVTRLFHQMQNAPAEGSEGALLMAMIGIGGGLGLTAAFERVEL